MASIQETPATIAVIFMQSAISFSVIREVNSGSGAAAPALAKAR